MSETRDGRFTKTYLLEVNPADSNHAYATGQKWVGAGRKISYRYLQNYYRDWKEGVKFLFRLQSSEADFIALRDAKLLDIEIILHWPYDKMYHENGELVRRDATGHVKLLEDAFAEFIGVDDKRHANVFTSKRVAQNCYIILKVTPRESF